MRIRAVLSISGPNRNAAYQFIPLIQVEQGGFQFHGQNNLLIRGGLLPLQFVQRLDYNRIVSQTIHRLVDVLELLAHIRSRLIQFHGLHRIGFPIDITFCFHIKKIADNDEEQ
ncbi:hypothetical protein D3C78_1331540 [compost metagenome]